MAVTAAGTGLYQFTAANDTIAGRIRLRKIHFVTGITGGTTTIKAGGSGGMTIWSGAPTVSTTTEVTFPSAVDVDDIIATAVGTNVVIVLFTA